MLKQVSVYPKNVEAAKEKLADTEILFADKEKSTLFIRVGKHGLEYYGDENKVVHNCTALSHGRPCYHLGALYYYIEKEGLPVPPAKRGLATFVIDTEEEQLKDVIDKAEVLKHMTDEEIDEKLEKQKAEAEKKKAEEDAKQKLYKEIEEGNDEILKTLSKILPYRLLQRLKTFREAQNSRLTEEQKSRVPSLKYIPSNGEFVKALSALLHPVWSAPLLTGPKGTGKSTLAESLVAALNLPVVKIYGGIDVNAEGLLGGKTLVPVENKIDAVTEMRLRTAAKAAGVAIEPILQKLKEVQLRVSFEPGLLLNPVLNGEMVVMEEVNMLQPDVTSLLHGLLDWSKQLSVPGYRTVTAPEYFRLVGTINPDYAGTKELNEAFEDRFRLIEVPYPERKVLLQVLLQETGIEKELAEVMVDIFERIRGRVENGDLDTRALSFRRLLRAAEDIKLEIDEPFKCIQSNLAEGLDEVEKNIIIEIVRDYQRNF